MSKLSPFGMAVPRGGSNCAKCEYVKFGNKCGNEHFIKWDGGKVKPAGSDRIPGRLDSYCCNAFEAKENDNVRSPHGFPRLPKDEKE